MRSEKEHRMRRMGCTFIAACLTLALAGFPAAQSAAQKPAGAGPVLVVETTKGPFQIET